MAEKPKQEAFFIAVLRWAKERGTFTKKEIRKRFNLDQDQVNSGLVSAYWHEMFYEVNVDGAMRYHISYNAYFNLLEHQELQEARQASIDANQNAENANISAKRAIYISIVALVISAAISVWQIFSTVSITQKQINLLTHPQATIDQKQIELITDRPIKLDPEQLEIIKSWIKQQKPKPEKTN